MPTIKGGKDWLKKVYREYARIKFKMYKHQFPRLRESEIVNKILKEWQGLGEEEKSNLQHEFTARSGSIFLNASSSSSRKRREQAEKKKLTTQSTKKIAKIPKKKKKISPKIRTFSGKTSKQASALVRQSSDFNRSEQQKKQGKKSTPDKRQSSSDLQYLTITKKIQKDRNRAKKNERILKKRTEQQRFKKYYTEKLSSEHPRWDKNQIATIVKLLWLRRQKTKRRATGVPKKGLSGRQMYSKSKTVQGFMKEQVKQMWKALPHQSKRYWQIQGKGKLHSSGKTTGKHIRKILNSGASKQRSGEVSAVNFGWMGRQIN